MFIVLILHNHAVMSVDNLVTVFYMKGTFIFIF